MTQAQLRSLFASVEDAYGSFAVHRRSKTHRTKTDANTGDPEHEPFEPQRRSTTPLASALHVTITDLVAEYELRHRLSQRYGPIGSRPSIPSCATGFRIHGTALWRARAIGCSVAPTTGQPQLRRRHCRRDSAVLRAPRARDVVRQSLAPEVGRRRRDRVALCAAFPTADGTARFSLPLVHRPHGRSKLDELDEPASTSLPNIHWKYLIRIKGLAGASARELCNPRCTLRRWRRHVSLNQAMLDRDLVLVFDGSPTSARKGRLVADGEGAIGMLTFTTPERLRAAGPCDLCLVLDGSGSMSGEMPLLNRVTHCAQSPGRFRTTTASVMRFGSHIVPLFRRPAEGKCARARGDGVLVDTVNSDLGGTERWVKPWTVQSTY